MSQLQPLLKQSIIILLAFSIENCNYSKKRINKNKSRYRKRENGMKRRLLATVCSAAILANMVPYQAFADNAQATPETAQSITLDSAAQAFAADGQTEAYNYKLKVAVSGVNGGYVKAGDKVKVAVTISDAAWATDANKAGFIAASIELTYDSEVLEPNYDEELGPKFKNLRNPNPNKSDTVSYTISGNIDENAGRLNWVVEAPNPAKIGKDQWRATYADLSENDTVIVTYSFTAKTDIPKGLSKSLGFNLTSKGKDNADSAFGDFVSQSNKLFVKATAEIENNTSLKVDTKAPTITLSDTANNGKFFYAPVGVTVADDGIGLASVTFGGKELTLSADGSYSLTESGTLTATDKLGNTSKLDITIDTTALDAARAAVAKLPDAAPDYTCKANLEAAEKAVENLKATDSAAYSKLTEAELNKIAAARTVVDAIDDEIQTAQADIAALPSDIQPTAITIEAVSKVRDQLKALTNKGVDVEKDVANYSIYKAAEEKLNAALEEIGGIKNDIKDFKYTGYGDKSAVSALRGKVTALQTKYGDDILSDADLKNLTDAEAAVKATGDKVDAVVTEIGKLPTSLKPLAAADSAVQAVKTSVEALVKEGVVPDTDISNYSDLVTLSEKVDAAKGEVNALKADIAGFTYTDYSDKTEVGNLNDRLNDLKAAYGDDILTDAELKNLTDAKNAVEQTNNEINAAVALINAKTATPLNPLSEAESALKDLRTAMDALADKGVDIENEISNYKKFADFEKTVNDASDAVKAAADEVAAFKYTGYGDKDAVAALRKKVDDLNKQYGDVLTGNAIKNLTDAETAVESTEKKIDAAIALIDTLPDKVEVTDANIKLISNIDSALDELTDLGVDNAKYVTNYNKYTKAKAALGQATEEIDAVKKKLKEFTYINYGKSAEATRELRQKADKLVNDYGDVLAESDLAKLVDGEKKVKTTETEITNVITAIGTLPTKDATLAEIEEIDAVTTRVNALLKDEEVPQAKITNYADYQKAVDAKAATEKAIADVKAQIEALPEKVTLEQNMIDQIYAAKKAAEDVQKAYGDNNHQALDDATLKKLETANNTLEALNGKRADLVKDLGSMVRAEDVKLTDKADVEKLRSRVKEMQDEDKATFTDAELKNLTAAEKALADLEQRSKNAHKAVAALPGADTVKLTEKADIEALNKEIAALETKGDSFTAAEKQKLADAQKGITDLEKAQADMKATLESLKDDKDVRYDDKAAEEKLSADIEALQDRGVAVDETTMGVNGWKRYTRYAAAVKAMNSELTGLNSKMQTELDSWTYPYDIAKYDALRKDMDAAAKKYGMTKEQTKAEFTNYETDKIQAAAVEEKIKQANAKIKALPATITKAQEQDVVAITAIVNELKAAPYKMTDSALQTALGSNYAIYTKAVATLAKLNKPADNNSSGSSNNNNSNSSNTTSTNNKTTTTSTANKITKPAAAATTIPQTSDAFPLTTLITLAVASLGGLIAVLFKKKRND